MQKVETYLPVIRAAKGYYSDYPIYAPIIDINSRLFNVKSLGAKGNGVTDDTDAIQKAAIKAKTLGGILFFPIGNYLISASINIGGGFPGGLIIEGMGWSSRISIKPNSNIYAFTFSGVYTPGLTIRDLYIDCNGNNQTTGGGIEAFGAVRCHFERLYIDIPCDDGIYLHHNGTGGFGQHNVIYGCTFTNGRNGVGTGYALRIESNDENTIFGCLFQDNGNPNASNACQVYEKAGLNSFQNCTFVGGGASSNALLKLQGQNNNVVNCTFDGCTNTHQIRLNGDNSMIVGSRFYKIGSLSPNSGAAKSAILIDNVNVAQITGNIFQPVDIGAGFSHSGIRLSGSVSDSLITGNQFSLHGTSGTWTQNGIFNNSTGSGNLISTNLGG